MFKIGTLNLQICPNAEAAGEAAAQDAAAAMRQLCQTADSVAVIFATGASQLEMLKSLTSIPDIPWRQVQGFHMDEYVGISSDHPASFRRYMREHLCDRVDMQSFREIDGNAADLPLACRAYSLALRSSNPRLCLLGIGENGHLAFNDPSEADFDDPQDMKVVTLDQVCRQQQLAEGWFPAIEEVPERALTLTIPTLLRVPRLLVSVPGARKAHIMQRTLREPISTHCPATILRTHPDVTIYLDRDSASELGDVSVFESH